MHLPHHSPLATRDSVVIGQNIFFACGISRTVWRTGALHSPHDSEHAENWRADHEDDAPTRLAGGSPAQAPLAESVSATQRICRACSGSMMARRGRS